MSEQVKQEGEFKMKASRSTPKKLIKTDQPTKIDLKAPKANEPIKVDLTVPKAEEPTKVVITKEPENAVQEQSPAESVLRAEQSEVELQEVGQGDERPVENVIEEISQQEVIEQTANLQQELEEKVQDQINTGKKLPENIEKLVSFMEETGGTVEVLGDHILLESSSKIDASGTKGGGTVHVGGEYQGEGETAAAKAVVIVKGAEINAGKSL